MALSNSLSVAAIAASILFAIAIVLLIVARNTPYADVGFVVPLGLEILAGISAGAGALILVFGALLRRYPRRARNSR